MTDLALNLQNGNEISLLFDFSTTNYIDKMPLDICFQNALFIKTHYKVLMRERERERESEGERERERERERDLNSDDAFS